MSPIITTTVSELTSEVDPESIFSRSQAFQAAGVPAPYADSLGRDAAVNQSLRDAKLKVRAESTRAVITPTPVGLRVEEVKAPAANPPKSVETPMPAHTEQYSAGYEHARRGGALSDDATRHFRSGFADFSPLP